MLKIIFLLLMSGGIPVAIAMAGSALIYIWWTGGLPAFVVIHRMISGIDSFPLLAVPFFILAGNLMNNAGITNRIYNYALALVGWMKGGLGHVNVVGSVIFAGMSGTAIADAAGLGTIEIKAMKDHGYSTEFAVGVTAASATLGPIIPPSLPFVIYGMMANVSVGSLFLAGILPGGLMAILMMLTVAYFAHKNGWGADVKFEWPRVIKALMETAVVIAWPVAMWLLIVKGGLPAQNRPRLGLLPRHPAGRSRLAQLPPPALLLPRFQPTRPRRPWNQRSRLLQALRRPLSQHPHRLRLLLLPQARRQHPPRPHRRCRLFPLRQPTWRGRGPCQPTRSVRSCWSR